MKTCTKCKTEKPNTDFPPSKQTRDGLSAWCRQCVNDQRKALYHSDPEHRERMKAKTRETYQNDPTYRESVKERSRKRSKEMTETGARKNDEQRAKQRRWAKNQDPSDVRRWKREWHRKQYETDPKWRENERQRSKEKREKLISSPEGLRRWRQYKRRSEHVRRALRRDAGTYTNAEWDQLCAAYNHRCLCCGECRPLTIDHVIPLSLGGSNTIDNLQPLCISCNDRKGTKSTDYRYPIGLSYTGPANDVAPPFS